MKKAPETPNKGGSYVREVSGTLTLKERTDAELVAEPVAAKPAAKKKEAK
ncbi:MAG: hypothetical protein GQ535_06680 [Rhodobacteraceae bacterium]|nr:hypothetical protein [Paracoccaceae bacterium]